MVEQGIGPLDFLGSRLPYCDDCTWLSFNLDEMPGLVSGAVSGEVARWVNTLMAVAGERAVKVYITASSDLAERSLALAVELDELGEDPSELVALLTLGERLANITDARGTVRVYFYPLEEESLIGARAVMLLSVEEPDMGVFLKLAGRLEDALSKARKCLDELDEVLSELEEEDGEELVLPEEAEILVRLGLEECNREKLRETVLSLARPLEEAGEEGVEEGEEP